MTESKIPKSIKEIIEVFIRFDFRPLPYKLISDALKMDKNAIVQRVKRNEEYFDIKGPRPFRLILKTGIDEIYFIRDKNQCQICRKTFKIDDLLIRFKNPNSKRKNNWENVITCCQGCKSKEISLKNAIKGRLRSKKEGVWEYKEIHIREHEKPFQWFHSDSYVINSTREEEDDDDPDHYYEFDDFSGQGWLHITDSEHKISSLNLADILNYFGEDEWELIKIKNIGGYDEENPELYQVFFKRKIKIEVNENGKK